MADESKVSLRLLVDPKAKKVVFAEAGKDFADFLFKILSLPIGTLVKLLNEKGMVISLDALCKNLETLNHATLGIRIFYQCLHHASVYADCRNNVTDGNSTICPSHNFQMSSQMNYVIPKNPMEIALVGTDNGTGGGCVTYLVMDNVEIKPMSSVISGVTILSQFNVKDVASLVENEVQIGLVEAVELLKACLQTKDVLTTVFLTSSEK